MESRLEPEILAASHPLRVPGFGERRVLSAAAVEQLASAAQVPGWAVEAAALEADVTPLHYLRNLAQFEVSGQIRLLRATIGIVGSIPVLERAVELLALNGAGSFILLQPAGSSGVAELAIPETAGLTGARRLIQAVRNRNTSCSVETRSLNIRGGSPAEALRGVDVAAVCLDDSGDEQLFQFACRLAKIPLVLCGVEGPRAHATSVYPGDPGVALVYRHTHPHLEANRARRRQDAQACMMAGAWLADQVTRILLEQDEVLRGKLLYADLERGTMVENAL